MRNPFLKNFNIFKYYLLAWATMAVVQAGIMHFYFGLAALPAVTDAVISNLLFSLMVLLLWNIVRYINIDTQKESMLLFNHAVLVALFLLAWVALLYLVLPVLSDQKEMYLLFFRKFLYLRLFTGFLTYSLVVLFYYLQLYRRTFKENLQRESSLYRAVKDTELQLLKSQLHPHFIFNSLNSINALMVIDVPGAQEMLVKLSAFLRKSLDKNDHLAITLEEELAYARLYLDIEKIRFGDKLIIEETIVASSLKCTLPHMLLQPLYENAIKHGVGQSLESVKLSISASLEKNCLRIGITNNYDAQRPASNRRGLGLKNVQKRLSLFYGRKDCFAVRDRQNIFEVILTIPQNS